MRFFVVITLALTMVLGVAVLPVQAGDNNWIGDEDGDLWSVGTNWSETHVPTTSERAVIDNGHRCDIPEDYTTAVARRIKIANSGSELRTKKGSILTLGDGAERTSKIEKGGVLQIGNDVDNGNATLKIYGDHKIKGGGTEQGGKILLVRDSVIDDSGHEGDELTIEDDCGVSCDINHKPTANCSLTVTGQGSIKVELYNDAFVVDDDAKRLTLADHDKDSGCCGFWIAQGEGVLAVQAVVTGAGTWQVVDPNMFGKLEIGDGVSNAGCVLATGNVFLTGGYETVVLHVQSNGHFCTEGSLVYASDPELPTQPYIEVDADVAAMFGVSACDATNCPE